MAQLQDEIKKRYLNYAMSVITSRAIPDVRDGLKPVQRRILYSMYNDLRLSSGGKHRKSAAIAGAVMGKYHPHGDQSIYDAMVRMAQDFNLRYPLVHGQGNYGSIDGDGAAAMRYCLTGDARVRIGFQTPCIRGLGLDESIPEEDVDFAVWGKDGESIPADKLFRCGEHPVWRLLTSEGFELRGTANHPVLCMVRAPKPHLEWKLLPDLQPGDHIVVYRGYDPQTMESEGDIGKAYLAGALVAEGSFSNGRIGFNNTNKAYYDRVVVEWERYVGGKFYTHTQDLPSGKTLYALDVHDTTTFASTDLAEMLGRNSYSQRIPECIWTGTRAEKRMFLSALYEGDGSFSVMARNSVQVSLSSRSLQLVKDVQTLLLEFGIISRHCTYASGEHKLVLSSRREVSLFVERVGFAEIKQAKATAALNSLPPSRGMSSDHVPHVSSWVREREGSRWLRKHNWDRIERITDTKHMAKVFGAVEDAETREVLKSLLRPDYYYAVVDSVEPDGVADVYSLRVDSEDHAFIANGFINHNTEARLSPVSERLLEELKDGTVAYHPNFDGTTEEPDVLPAQLPNLLLNGSTGIAVGMATNIPPHNAGEVLDACVDLIKNPTRRISTLVKHHIKGPDFPTGGVILEDQDEITSFYKEGSGSFTIRAKWHLEDVSSNGKKAIIVTEVPYSTNKSTLVEKIANHVANDKIPQITDVRDESTDDVRLVLELKRGADEAVALAYLFKHTPLEDRFHMNLTCLFPSDTLAVPEPKQADLKEILQAFLDFRLEVTTRRLQHQLDGLESRIHILEAFEVVFEDLQQLIDLVRSATSKSDARQLVIDEFGFDEDQAEAIISIPLYRLANTEKQSILDELEAKRRDAARLRDLLDDEDKRWDLVRSDLRDLANAYGDERRTQIEVDVDDYEYNEEDFIESEDVYVIASRDGWVRTQKSYGDLTSLRCRDNDEIGWALPANTKDTVLFFTSKASCYTARVADLTMTTGYGDPIQSMFQFGDGERIVNVLTLSDLVIPDINDDETDVQMVSVSESGRAVRFDLEGFEEPSTVVGRSYMRLEDDDAVVNCAVVRGSDVVVLATHDGRGTSFEATEVKKYKGVGKGVKAMSLADDDEVLAFELCGENQAENLYVETNRGAERMITHQTYQPVKRGAKGYHILKRGHLIRWKRKPIEIRYTKDLE